MMNQQAIDAFGEGADQAKQVLLSIRTLLSARQVVWHLMMMIEMSCCTLL